LDVEQHVEVARRPAVLAGLTLAAQLQARAGVHAGGNLHVHVGRLAPGARAVALGARVRHDLALPVALPARLRDRAEAVLEAHLAGAVALRTGLRRGAGLRTAAAARLASRESRNRERLLDAPARFDEGDLQLVLQVGPAPRARAAATPAPGAEEVAEQV